MKPLSGLTLDDLNHLNRNTLMESLGIEYLEVEAGYVRARMPVDRRTIQPVANILHGGASLALAETVGSLGSILITDMEKYDGPISSIIFFKSVLFPAPLGPESTKIAPVL
jgi:acyl-coenzyme A thioesterase PaaI-like protein